MNRRWLSSTATAVLSALPAIPLPVAAEAPAQAQHPPPNSGESLPVVRHVLDNGLTFLVLERPQSPTAALVVHYPVGSVNERLGNTGTAHVLEHMMFKGTEEIGVADRAKESPLLEAIDAARDSVVREQASARPDSARIRRLSSVVDALEDQARAFVEANEFDRILSAQGARGLNATTSYEATQYIMELPANRLELWFALESDRMANPVFREFYTELDVVAEERRLRLETSPGGVLQAAFLATAFQVHPYGVPVVGHSSDLASLTRSQIREYFRSYYGAQNAVVAVVGGVDAEQVKDWADHYFASVPEGSLPPPVTAREPAQNGERRIAVEFPAEPRLMIGWRAVSGLHADFPALQMLASVLSAGRTTRLYRRLVDGDRSAIHVSSYLGPGFAYPGLFIISAVPRASYPTEDLEAAIYAEIDRLKEAPPEAQALLRIKNQVRAGEFRRLSSNLGLAQQLAESEAAFSDWRETFRISRRILDVTPEDVQRVAQAYLTDRTRTVAVMIRREP